LETNYIGWYGDVESTDRCGSDRKQPIKDKSHIRPGLPVTYSDRRIGKKNSIQDEDLARN
jgi:hypothetical protein